MIDMGVSAMVRMEPEVCSPSPHRHANGQRLKGQWAIPFFTWEIYGACFLMQHVQQLLPSLMLLEQDQRMATEAEASVEN